MGNEEKSTTSFLQMIKLAAIGATKQGQIQEIDDWKAVIQHAHDQSVFPLIGCALFACPEIICPEDLRTHLLDAVRMQSGKNLVRKQRVFSLIAEMEQQGIPVKLIKGYAVGLIYAYPECRNSTDTDLLIDVCQEERVLEFLKTKGFRITDRGDTEHHTVCQHPKLGMIEVHVHLYGEFVRSIWFKDAKQRYLIRESPISIQDKDGKYVTLGHTDHLLFITLHTIKHFIYDGLGVRMMLDIALFFKHYKQTIDSKRYWMVLNELNYTTVVQSILIRWKEVMLR